MNPFASGMKAQPWIRAGSPPWHLWGGSETVELFINPASPATEFPVQTVQLARVSYKRPDTFNCLLVAKMLSGPFAGAGDGFAVNVVFDLILGLGRANVILPAFQTLSWIWNTIADAPVNSPLYATTGRAVQAQTNVGGVVTRDREDPAQELVAQDIQCSARAQGGGNITGTVRLELSSFFAPVAHVRPDWYQDGETPIEAVFPGAEVGGK